MEDEENLMGDATSMGMQVESNEFEKNSTLTSDELDKELTSNSISNFFKKCDTTSSPTSSTPIHVASSPPLILSNSSSTTTHQEIVYNNNGFRIKSSVSEYDTNYNFEKNGSTKVTAIYQNV